MNSVPLYQMIHDYFLNKIIDGTLKENDKIPTEKELMEEFNVSRITVKNAINQLAKAGYVVRIPGRGTFVGSTKAPVELIQQRESRKLIGVILCDVDYTFGVELLKSLEAEVEKQGYHLVFKRSHESRESEMEAINELIQIGVEGIIIQAVHGEFYSNSILRLHLEGFPVVFVDRHMEKTSVPFVSTNNEGASAEITKRLIKAGYKNIAFMSAKPTGTTTLEQRYQGFRDVYHEYGKYDVLNLETPVTRRKTSNLVLSDLEKIEKKLLEYPEIDCIFAGEMYVAKLAKRVLKEIHKSVPEDIGIVTFDTDTSSSKHAYYTHIRQNETKMGSEAIRLLVKSIEGTLEETKRRIYVNAGIYVGKSTRKI